MTTTSSSRMKRWTTEPTVRTGLTKKDFYSQCFRQETHQSELAELAYNLTSCGANVYASGGGFRMCRMQPCTIDILIDCKNVRVSLYDERESVAGIDTRVQVAQRITRESLFESGMRSVRLKGIPVHHPVQGVSQSECIERFCTEIETYGGHFDRALDIVFNCGETRHQLVAQLDETTKLHLAYTVHISSYLNPAVLKVQL